MTGTATRQTRHNNALLNLLSTTHSDVVNDPINEKAFYYNKSTGNFKGCNEVTANRSERNARGAIVNAILDAGTRDHQRLALRNATTDRRIKDLVASLGLNMEEIKVAIHLVKNTRKVLMRSRMKSSHRGNVSKAKQLIGQTVMLAAVQSPDRDATVSDKHKTNI